MILSLVACNGSDSTTESEDITDPIITPPDTNEPKDTEEITPDTGTSTDTTGDGETEKPDEPEIPDEPEFTEVNETVYVYGTDFLNVRKEASADSEKMGEMKEGEQVTRIGYNNKWSKILYYENEYYASSEYLTTHAPLEFDDKTDTVYIIAEGTLNIRKKPAANSDVVAYLPYGTQLARTGIATTEDEFGTVWSRLLYNGQVCYVSTSYLSETAPAVLPEADFKEVNDKVYIASTVNDKVIERLNLRSTPSLSGNIVASVPAGTELLRLRIATTADGDGIIWSMVKYNEIVCYASSSYLTTEAPVVEGDETTVATEPAESPEDADETTTAAE